MLNETPRLKPAGAKALAEISKSPKAYSLDEGSPVRRALVDCGLATSRYDLASRLRLYTITPAGSAALAAHEVAA